MVLQYCNRTPRASIRPRIGVVVAALAIAAFDAYWADPAASLVISVLVVAAVVGVLRDAISVLLESVPRGIDTAEVTTALAALDGVTGVQDIFEFLGCWFAACP